ncbi:MAG: hypothetical protein EPN91_02375 [Salinibacterium sp.]|nr:MAG: hypothetical protein EPN91_02375 [Salinibacterium sp.]
MTTFLNLREQNIVRCREGYRKQLSDWTLLEWAGAAAGEMGEAANIAKKLRRIDGGFPGNAGEPSRELLVRELGREIADVVVYLDLLAAAAGLPDLGVLTASKWNEISERIGSPLRLS